MELGDDDKQIFVEIFTHDEKTILSGVVAFNDNDKGLQYIAENIFQRFVNNLVSLNVTYGTAKEEDINAVNTTALRKTIEHDFLAEELGSKFGLKYLSVTLPKVPSTSKKQLDITSTCGGQRSFRNLLREYIGYRVPIYVPFTLALLWVATYKPAPDEVCFARVGCFSLEAPWTERPLIFNFVPQSPAAINTTFRVFSRDKNEGIEIPSRSKDPDISQFTWDSKKVVVIVHGFTDDANTWIRNLSSAFVENDDVNVIAVDWYNGAQMYYPQVVANCRVVAAEIAMFLDYIKNTKGEKLGDIHLVGHSLGSHISGYVGKQFPGIKKITALDPAAPLFDSVPADIRLDKADAAEVEVIHSNIAPLGFGLREAIGTIDIYLNDGQDQIGCMPMLNVLLSPPTIETITDMKGIIACSHRRAYELYEDSIRSNYTLDAYSCSSWESFQSGSCISHCNNADSQGCYSIAVAQKSTPNQHGVFYMKTTEKSPFCLTFGKLTGFVSEHQIQILNVQLSMGLTEPNTLIFEGTINKLQPINHWLEINCHKVTETSMQVYVEFSTTDIVRAPIFMSNLTLEVADPISKNLLKYSINYTEVYRDDCNVLRFY